MEASYDVWDVPALKLAVMTSLKSQHEKKMAKKRKDDAGVIINIGPFDTIVAAKWINENIVEGRKSRKNPDTNRN
jgi:hypothetical protein